MRIDGGGTSSASRSSTPPRGAVHFRPVGSPDMVQAVFKQMNRSPGLVHEPVAAPVASPQVLGYSSAPARTLPSPGNLSTSTSSKVISPITPLGDCLLEPWARQRMEWDLNYQPHHHQFVIAALTHTARRLWAVFQRLKRTCAHEAFLDWRDTHLRERLDGRLKKAADFLKGEIEDERQRSVFSPRRMWHKASKLVKGRHGKLPSSAEDTELETLKKRLQAIGAARRAVPGVLRLTRSLTRLRKQRLTSSLAHWKDVTILPYEAWLAMTHIRQNSCPSWRYHVLGASETELHQKWLPLRLQDTRQQESVREEMRNRKGQHRAGACLLRSAMHSQQSRICAEAFAKMSAVAAEAGRAERNRPPVLDDVDAGHTADQQQPEERSDSVTKRTSSPVGSGTTPTTESQRMMHVTRPSMHRSSLPADRSFQTQSPRGARNPPQEGEAALPDQLDSTRYIVLDLGKDADTKSVGRLSKVLVEALQGEAKEDMRSSRKSGAQSVASSRRSKKTLSRGRLPYMAAMDMMHQASLERNDSSSSPSWKFSSGSGSENEKGQDLEAYKKRGSAALVQLLTGSADSSDKVDKKSRTRYDTAFSINPKFADESDGSGDERASRERRQTKEARDSALSKESRALSKESIASNRPVPREQGVHQPEPPSLTPAVGSTRSTAEGGSRPSTSNTKTESHQSAVKSSGATQASSDIHPERKDTSERRQPSKDSVPPEKKPSIKKDTSLSSKFAEFESKLARGRTDTDSSTKAQSGIVREAVGKIPPLSGVTQERQTSGITPETPTMTSTRESGHAPPPPSPAKVPSPAKTSAVSKSTVSSKSHSSDDAGDGEDAEDYDAEDYDAEDYDEEGMDV